MTLNCDWEPEHGMEWIIKGDKALYIGPFNGGASPWDEEEEFKESVGNYA